MKIPKLTKSVLTLSIVAFSATSAFAAVNTFTDSSTFASWFSPSVTNLSTIGVIKGYPDGSFKPENNVNRAELATMFDRYDTYINGRIDSQITAAANYLNGTNAGNIGNTDNSSDSVETVDLSNYLTSAQVEAMISQKLDAQLTDAFYAQVEADIMAELTPKLIVLTQTTFDSGFPAGDAYAPYVAMAYAGFLPTGTTINTSSYNQMYTFDNATVYKDSSTGFYVVLSEEVQTNPGAPHGSELYTIVETSYGPY